MTPPWSSLVSGTVRNRARRRPIGNVILVFTLKVGIQLALPIRCMPRISSRPMHLHAGEAAVFLFHERNKLAANGVCGNLLRPEQEIPHKLAS